MPIPQPKSNFHKRKVRDSSAQFTSRKININKVPKKRRSYFLFQKIKKKKINFRLRRNKEPQKKKLFFST